VNRVTLFQTSLKVLYAYLIISDIHSNYAALEAVLADAGPFSKIWCLGDLVVMGRSPTNASPACATFHWTCLVGNHDWAVIGKLDLRYFNNEARTACVWTRNALTPENRAYLESLPAMCVESNYTLAHGSPSHPIEEYILDSTSAEHNFGAFDTRVCLVGHTHWPPLSGKMKARIISASRARRCGSIRFTLDTGTLDHQSRQRRSTARWQPQGLLCAAGHRDERVEYRRVAYPVEETQLRMREHGLSKRLIERLASGH